MFSVVSGPVQISGLRSLSFTRAGLVTVRASQAGNATYEPAPDVDRTFRVVAVTPFKLTAVALTNNVVLRWPDPQDHGYASSMVMLRYSSDDYPGSANLVAEAYTGTNQMVNHTGLTAGITNYYSIFVTDDEETFVAPE